MRSIHGGSALARLEGRSGKLRLAAAAAAAGTIAGGALLASSAHATVVATPGTTAVSPASLATVDGDSANAWPFNCGGFGVASQRYQQVYAGAEVGSGTITQLAFRPDAASGGAFGPTTLPGVTITLSSTTKPVGGLSKTWADNVGSDVETVYQGDLTLSSADTGGAVKDFDVRIPLQHPFAFDATAGNLLIDVTVPTCETTTFLDATVIGGSSISRSYTYLAGSDAPSAEYTDSWGLVTQFTFNLVKNGSFEDPALATDVQSIAGGDSSLTGWTVGDNGVDVVNGLLGSVAADGTQYVDLNANAQGSVAQTLSTVAGQFYTLSFQTAPNPGLNADFPCAVDGNRTMSVLWDGQNVGDFRVDPTGQTFDALQWAPNSIPVTASGESTDLEFDGTNPGCAGVLLDAVSVVARQDPQAITFGSLDPVTYSPGETLDLTGTSDSGLPVSYGVTGPCSVDGSTLTVIGAGSCVITASQAGNNNYLAAASVPETLIINKATQAISFALPSSTAYYPGLQETLAATADSGLPVTYSLRGPCSMSLGTLNINGAGTCTVEAGQLGNANYLAATSVFQSIVISRGSTAMTLTEYTVHDLLNPARTSLPLAATLMAAGVPVVGAPVVFSVGRTGVCTAMTGPTGMAACNVAGVALRQLRLIRSYAASYAGDANLIGTTMSKVVRY